MKKFFIFCLMAFVMCVNANAQTKQYCEIVGTTVLQGVTKVQIIVDFGQEQKAFTDQRLVDEQGNVMKFNSMVDALNYMGTLGYEFVQAYVVSHGNYSVYHWLLSIDKELYDSVQIQTKNMSNKKMSDSTHEDPIVDEKDMLISKYETLLKELYELRAQRKLYDKDSKEYLDIKAQISSCKEELTAIENAFWDVSGVHIREYLNPSI